MEVNTGREKHLTERNPEREDKTLIELQFILNEKNSVILQKNGY